MNINLIGTGMTILISTGLLWLVKYSMKERWYHCNVCQRNFALHPNHILIECNYCHTKYIVRSDKSIVKQ